MPNRIADRIISSLNRPDVPGLPDIDLARYRLAELYDTLSRSDRRRLQESRLFTPVLLHAISLSPFIHQSLTRHPQFIKWLDDQSLEESPDKRSLALSLGHALSGADDLEEFSSRIRSFRLFHTIRIALRELGGIGSVTHTMKEMSDLADVVVSACLRFTWRLLTRQHGTPRLSRKGRPCLSHFSVIDLGKLGGEELNFSSDIDIIYLYDSEKGETDGDHPLNNAEFYRRLSELLTRLVSEKTPQGFGFRVDLGLRPDGQYGDIASSLRSMEVYYEAWGKLWERAVWIKARHGAGHAPLTQSLLSSLRPFVYRKYLDFTAIEEIRDLKLKMDQENRLRRKGQNDIKLGHGGIREIEFFVQALQLIHGGKIPRLQCRKTLDILRRLQESRLIREEECDTLTNAYLFLRRLEHRIQLIHQRQTQTLPSDENERLRLARSLGFSGNGMTPVKKLESLLSAHRERVHQIYADLFHTPSRQSTTGISPDIQALFTENISRDIALAWLEENGFRFPEKALATIERLRDGPPSAHYVPKTLSRLSRLLPSLLQSVIASPDPDMALGYLLSFVEKIGARGTFYSLLLENPPVLKLLTKVFGSSRFLSAHLIHHPELLDELIHPEQVVIFKTRKQMEERLRDMLQDVSGDVELEMDNLRKFKHAEIMRIGINDIYSDMDIRSVTEQLSHVATICLESAYQMAVTVQRARYTLPDDLELPFIILGLGKLGGMELNYSSDLDLIFLFDDTDHGRLPSHLDPFEFYGKLAQRFISVMSSKTAEGTLYEIDTRLRPSGTFGPIVTSLRSFRAYHQKSAWFWERHALIKARPIAGPQEMFPHVESLLDEIVYAPSLTEKEKEELLTIRRQMETEISKESFTRFHVKCGRGGLVDIEFLIQYYQLKHGRDNPEVRQTNTLSALDALAKTGIIPTDTTQTLRKNYLFLRRLENRLQILENRSSPVFNPTGPESAQLARRMGYRMKKGEPAAKRLHEDYLRKTEENRLYFIRHIGSFPNP